MLYRNRRAHSAGLLSFCALSVLAGSVARAATEIPDPAWNPGTYYSAVATPNLATFKTDLHNLIFGTYRSVSYDNMRQAFAITDRIPGGTVGSNLLTIYDRKSVSSVWDSGVTWNREHMWPQSRLDNDHDMFGIRPALSATNSGRGNQPYGGVYDSGAPRILTSGPSAGQFYPGDFDKGDVARNMFYMATEYFTSESAAASGTNLKFITTKASTTASYTMGDREAALHWNYTDMPDNFERRRNQVVFKNPENDTYSQRNRNPFVDHPEYVWAVFGTENNDSQISVAAPTSTGASTNNVNFGRVIVGGTAPTLSTSVTVSKTGADPTTYSVTTAGAATADGVDSTAAVRSNTFNGFDYGTTNRSLAVGLSGVTTGTAGLKSGTVTIDNTDLTSKSAGAGATDGDDTINLGLTVVDHSNASFAAGSDVNSLTLNFGTIDKNQTATLGFSVYNLLAASGYTAGLDLDGITASGDTAVFGSGLGVFSALAGGSAAGMTASFAPTAQGAFSATYLINVSDENLSGATAGTSLSLTLTGVATVPEPTIIALVPMLGLILRRRRSI